MRKRSLLAGGAGLAFSLLAGAQTAQTYPARPVKMVVPSTPGGSADLVGRAIAQKLSEIWPQPVVVDNRPGAGDAADSPKTRGCRPPDRTVSLAISQQ